MIGRELRGFHPKALIVDDGLAKLDTALGRATEGLARALGERDVDVVREIVANDVEPVPVDRLANRVAANAVMPYPPGIPMLMSGENFGGESSPQILYMRGLETWDRQFPGFEHVTEGAEIVDGTYHVLCVR
jgi:arginine/lysine/ornithine decarboxylase